MALQHLDPPSPQPAQGVQLGGCIGVAVFCLELGLCRLLHESAMQEGVQDEATPSLAEVSGPWEATHNDVKKYRSWTSCALPSCNSA